MTDPRDPAERLAALEADNARLRRLLDEAGMPDSLRQVASVNEVDFRGGIGAAIG